MGIGARQAQYRRAEAERAEVEVSARRVPKDQADGIAGHIATRKAACLSIVDDESEAGFKRSEALGRMRVLDELAVIAGAATSKPKQKGKAKEPAAIAPPGAHMPLANFKVYQRRVVTPEGWRDTLGKKLFDTAEECLAKMLKGESVEHSAMLRQECLKLERFLSIVEADGLAAEGDLARQQMRVVANGGR